jgi:hypothetical protein
MVASLVALLLLTAAAASPDTTPPFADAVTRELIARAMARHRERDSAVTDYRARIRYRLSATVGRRRWAQIPITAVEEQEALVQWALPNDLRIDVVGRRFRTRDPAWDLSSVFYRPWFVPRGVGDSVRIFSDNFPATGALHPLAETGPNWYRYALRDSLTVAMPGGERIRILVVDVVPRRTGLALIAGRLWIEAGSAEVVRLTFRYVGTQLFVRPSRGRRSAASARRLNKIANRIVSVDADLEYALQEGKFWMPYRQSIAGRVQLPMFGDLIIPFHAVTTFSDYQLNTGRPIAFTLPLPDTTLPWDSVKVLRRMRHDSIQAERQRRNVAATRHRSWNYADVWSGGRYEIHRPPNDSLARYAAWDDSLTLAVGDEDLRQTREVESELARMSDTLPAPLTGGNQGLAYERLADAFRYDRVQGYSIGLGYHLRVPGLEFSDLVGTLRYGFSDDRVTARLSFIRDAPGGRLRISGYRDVVSVDPIALGPSFANTFNAIFVAHDDADYALATGGSLTYETSLGVGWDLSATGRIERQRSITRQAKSGVNDFLGGDGVFPENPPITDGTFGGATLRLLRGGRTSWTLTADLLGGAGTTTLRSWGELRKDVGGRAGATLRAKAGIATTPVLPQMGFRLGGLNTVRGFDYGTLVGQAFWSAQLDLTPLAGRVRPVVFLDAGQAGSASGLFDTKALVGAGAGVSLLRGAIRLDLSRRLSPDVARLRFDLVFGAVR